MADVFAVFEGGGVKGIAHVGALARFHEEKNLQFKGYAGTSAGAIVASLAAVGYQARNPNLPQASTAPHDLNSIMAELDFAKLLGTGDSIPFNKLQDNVASFRLAIPRLLEAGKELQKLSELNPLMQLIKARTLLKTYQSEFKKLVELPDLFERLSASRGMYEASAIVEWLRKYLESKGGNRVTFYSLQEATGVTLKIVATDLIDPQPRIYGPIETRNVEIALAVQASISIPLFFCPFIEGTNLLVDGGLRSNYPLWIFDNERKQNNTLLPIIGFRLETSESSGTENQSLDKLEGYVGGVINAALEGTSWRQKTGIENVVEVAIPIPANVHATSFDLDNTVKENLFYRGYMAASAVLSNPDTKKILGLV